MIKLRAFGLFGLFLLFLPGLFSCDDEKIIATAEDDAFITVKVEKNDTLYGLVLHGFGTRDFASVSATDEEGLPYTLSSYNHYTYEYIYKTNNDLLSKTIPTIGEYNFSNIFLTGTTYSSTNYLSKDCIYPTAITTCEYDSTEEKINLEWDINGDADFIVIYLTDEDGNTTFVSNSINGSSTSYSISSDTDYWGNFIPINGTRYTVTIYMYLYETTGEDLNIQCRAENNSTVIWGK